jgi:tyrosyl-tRNA synthetase
MKLSEELQARGFVNQFSAESLSEILDGEKRTVYHGIDPTADSAHAGNFVVWILLRHLADHGHNVIFLVGGGTGMIGDPKPDVERTLSAPEEVASRVVKLKAQAERLLGGREIRFVNNYDWLGKIDLITFLRDIGKHFTVNELIKKDAIATRLSSEAGISYTEFAYPLLQAFDYLTLHREYGCDLQVGGSDQWGNILAGVDLIRRIEQQTAYALTVPLIIDKATGKKFGKSEGNAVWLDAEKTSPYAFYQFWLNTSDESVIDFLKLFTFLPLQEIAAIERDFAANPGSRSAQRTLAYEVTAFVHGRENADMAARVSASLFGETPFSALSEAEISILKDNAPHTELANGSAIIDALIAAELAASKREARTFLESGAVLVNGEKVDDPALTLEKERFGETLLLKRGKKLVSVITLQ